MSELVEVGEWHEGEEREGEKLMWETICENWNYVRTETIWELKLCENWNYVRTETITDLSWDIRISLNVELKKFVVIGLLNNIIIKILNQLSRLHNPK